MRPANQQPPCVNPPTNEVSRDGIYSSSRETHSRPHAMGRRASASDALLIQAGVPDYVRQERDRSCAHAKPPDAVGTPGAAVGMDGRKTGRKTSTVRYGGQPARRRGGPGCGQFPYRVGQQVLHWPQMQLINPAPMAGDLSLLHLGADEPASAALPQPTRPR